MIPLIFIYIGDKLPRYLNNSIEFSINHSQLPIILLISSNILDQVCITSPKFKIYPIEDFYIRDEYFRAYEKNFIQDKELYIRSLERFFVLYEFVIKHKIDVFIHGEVDNIFFSLESIIDKVRILGKGIYLPRINHKYMIASIVICNSVSELKSFLEYVLLTRITGTEMELLSNYQSVESSRIYTLPTSIDDNELIISNNRSLTFDYVGAVFDASVFGHWLFGPDPSNRLGLVTNKFLNKNNKSIDPRMYKFYFDYEKSVFTIQHKKLNTNAKLMNLHIHSKVHNSFLGKKFTRTINRVNVGLPTVISYNIESFLKLKMYKYYLYRLFSVFTNRSNIY